MERSGMKQSLHGHLRPDAIAGRMTPLALYLTHPVLLHCPRYSEIATAATQPRNDRMKIATHPSIVIANRTK